MLFGPCFVKEATTNVDTKALNMRHHPHRGSWGISVGIPQHQKMLPHICSEYT